MGTAILYKANQTQFNHLGLGPLNDAVSILVTEERNGIFELEMKYPVSGKVFHELKNDRIIKADAGHKLKDQRFKIIRISKPLKGIVTVYAEHVSYLTQDLALKPKVTFSGNARQALEHWKANLVDDNPLTVWSDISTVGKINWSIDEVENARRALGGVQGSILDVYGGEYLFDNYDIYLYQKRGVNSELLIAYGRNLVDLEQEEEIANTYTSIYPYSIYTDDDGNERMVTLPEYYIDSEHVDKYARRKILVVDFSTDEIETVSALRSAARRYIKDNDVGVPKVNLKIQYVDLAKTLDYKDLALYEEVNLCDNVMIYFEKYDINTTAKVIKVVWDVLNERYDSIEVGEARASLSQAIDTVVDGKVHSVEKLAMQTLRTADGKNTIYFGLEEPLATQYPLKKNDIWYRIVDGEFTRTYRYDGVTWQLIIDMDSQEAKEEARQAQERADEAVNRANQATEDANAAIGQAQASFDLAQENATQIDSLGLQIGNVEDGLTTISGTIDGLQTTVSDVKGNVTNLTQLSTTLQSRLSDAEGNINTLTLTSKSMQSTISSLQTELDELEVGDRNLVLESNKGWRSTEYNVIQGYLSEDWIVGETYTVILKGNINDGQVFRVWRDRGSTAFVALEYNKEKDLWIGTDVARETSRSEKNRFSVYNFPNSGATEAEVEWIKIVRGNKTSLDWTPAPEDMATQSQITQLSDAINLRVKEGDVINQINLDTSGVLISGKKLILDGDTTVLGTFKLDGSAHIKDASIGTAQIGTIDAAIANIINLSANSIVGGVLQSQNDNITFDLNRSEFNIRSGGQFNFLDSNNGIKYITNNHASGMILSTSLGYNLPLVAVGVDSGSGNINANSPDFTGIRIHSRDASHNNSLVGGVWQFTTRPDYSTASIIVKTDGSTGGRGIFPQRAGTYNYDLGTGANYWNDFYIKGDILNQGVTTIRDNTGVGGWRIETRADSGSTTITLRGINTNQRNYNLGASGYRINRIYLSNSPDVSSDERLKTDISNNVLGLDFINDVNTVNYRLNKLPCDVGNLKQNGVIAQQLLPVLVKHGVDVNDTMLVRMNDDGYYSVAYEQFIAPLIKSVQELDTKLTDNVDFLKLKVQYLEQKIKLLEEKVA